jgi:hypothetical protein
MIRDNPLLELWYQAYIWSRRCFGMLPIREHTMSQIQDMIETLAAAKQAMEENPHLQYRVEELQNQLRTTEADYTELGLAHVEALSSYASANARIKALEADLEAARFRELASSQKLETLVSAFRGTLDEVSPVLVPATEPNVELVATDAEVLTQTQVEHLTRAEAEAVANQAEASHTSQSFIEVDPEPKPTVRLWAKPEIEEVERSFYPDTADEVTAGPSLGDLLRQDLDPADMEKTEALLKTEEFQQGPYSGKPFSFKPDHITWPEWVAGGGTRPWWLTDDELAKLSQPSAA